MDREAASAELRRRLDPDAVKSRNQAGRSVQYIEGWHAIAEANRIFGEFNWQSETLDLNCVNERERPIGQRQEPGWTVTYTARVRITVDGVVRDGCGAGHGIAKDLGECHESAIKEAETDARKRALMTFGNPLGLALYDKDRANVGRDDPPPPDYPAIRDRIKKRIERCVSQDDLRAVWDAEKEDRNLLYAEDRPKALELVAARDAMMAKLQPHTPAPEIPGDFLNA